MSVSVHTHTYEKTQESHLSLSHRKPREYIAAILDLSTLVVKRQHYLPHHWDWLYWRSEQGRRFRKACDIVHGFTADVVKQRRLQLDQQGDGKNRSVNQEYTGGYKKKDTDLIDLLLLSKVSHRFDEIKYISH